jgi:FAD synthase
VAPFTLDGRAVRSSDIRSAIAAGDLPGAEMLLGRPVTLRGALDEGSLTFDWPLALPPDGDYACTVDGSEARLRLADRRAHLDGGGRMVATGPVEVSLRA